MNRVGLSSSVHQCISLPRPHLNIVKKPIKQVTNKITIEGTLCALTPEVKLVAQICAEIQKRATWNAIK